MSNLIKYEPMAMVTFKDGSSPVFVPADDGDAIGQDVNTSKTPLVHIGNRWTDRYNVKEIVQLADYDAKTAKGWLPICQAKWRARLATHISKNEEVAGHPLDARWAQATVAAWEKDLQSAE